MESGSAEQNGAPRGRPRDASADARILRAALDLLGRDGYARMSLEAVASEAGVTRPTIYRRYPGKAELATAALASLAADRDETAPLPSGDLRRDLIAQLRHFRTGVGRPFGVALVGTVLAEEHETPELLAMYRRHVVAPRREMIRAVLEAGRDRGEVDPAADLDLLVNLLVGAFYAQRLEGRPFPALWEEAVVDVVLEGVRPEVRSRLP